MKHVRGNLLDRLHGLDPAKRAALLGVLAQRGEEFDVYPLSSAQQRLWLFSQTYPDAASYNMPFAYWLRGEVCTASLSAAFTDLVARHASLRTVFLDVDGEPLQAILPASSGPLEISDLRTADVADRNALARERATAQARRPFDLAAEPPIRARLWRTDDDTALLALAVHHIACDGWSMGILLADLAEFYRARRAGTLPDQAPPPWRYADYATWQARWWESDAPRAMESYWEDRLAGAPRVLDLPTDRPRPVKPTVAGGMEWFEWSAEVRDAVSGFSVEAEATPFTVLFAAWAALLHRYSASDDLVIGVPAAGRTRPETEDVVGLFVNMLALRSRAPGVRPSALWCARPGRTCWPDRPTRTCRSTRW